MVDDRYDIFISYSHRDKKDVISFEKFLKKRGYITFRDDDQIAVGESIRNKVFDGLSKSIALLCWVTENWHASRFSSDELDEFYRSNQDSIFNVVASGSRPPKLLGGRKYIERNPGDRQFKIACEHGLKKFLDNHPESIANRILSGNDQERSAYHLHRLITLHQNEKAQECLEKLMINSDLPLTVLDYCFRYYHYSFRNILQNSMHLRAVHFLSSILNHPHDDIVDKAAYSLGEIYLYSPLDNVKQIAKQTIENRNNYPGRAPEHLEYTARRVGINL